MSLTTSPFSGVGRYGSPIDEQEVDMRNVRQDVEMRMRRQPTMWDIAFAVKGTILPKIARHLMLIALISIIAILASLEHPGIFARFGSVPFTLIGIALSVFMSFRNNACYSRWWEARHLWGELIIACRSLARQTAALAPEDRTKIIHGLCGFTAGLTARLRRNNEADAIGLWCNIGAAAKGPNPTNAVLESVGNRCLQLVRSGKIDSIQYSVLDGQLSTLARIQGGCERILNTPVPFSYSLLLHRTAIVFCTMLPFALAGSLGWWTLLPVLIVAYTFFGLDALGHQLEEPFSLAPNALPLYSLRQIVEREMTSILELANTDAGNGSHGEELASERAERSLI